VPGKREGTDGARSSSQRPLKPAFGMGIPGRDAERALLCPAQQALPTSLEHLGRLSALHFL
jgi:hypothetical protein